MRGDGRGFSVPALFPGYGNKAEYSSDLPLGWRPSLMPQAARRAADMETPFYYRICDRLTEAVIYFMVIFSPWAFGSTQPWAVAVMNCAGGVLGLLLVGKWVIRWRSGYRPARWWDSAVVDDSGRKRRRSGTRAAGIITVGMAVMTVLIVGYCLASALNSAATYDEETQLFSHRKAIRWLPHSFSRGDSWVSFWGALGLACMFWAVRDWLLAKSARELEEELDDSGRFVKRRGGEVPERLRHLLWVLSINGVLLGVEAIAQRMDGGGKLLWLREPAINKTAEAQFGPYAYRSNAAQYFNLLWPVCLGFWLTLQRTGQYLTRRPGHLGVGAHHLLLFAAGVMAICPLVALSRACAVVSAGMMALCLLVILVLEWRSGWGVKVAVSLAFLGVLYVGLDIGIFDLQKRLGNLNVDYRVREEICQKSWPIAHEHPWFGTGPGTFATIYQLYLTSSTDIWFAQVHNDWLETLVTFGRVGSGILAVGLLLVLIRGLFQRGIRLGVGFHLFYWIAFLGLAVEARFDFPLQVYSILFLFVLLGSVLTCVTRRSS